MKESFDALIDHLVQAGFFLEQAVEVLEKGMIERVLSRTEGNQSEASKILGIHRNTLLRKMVEYDIGGRRPRRKPAAQALGKRVDSRTARRNSAS
jgi:DNA-binding NtrC family response regulator